MITGVSIISSENFAPKLQESIILKILYDYAML